MQFTSYPFETPVQITRLVNLHYFEFTNDYHTQKDRHDFYELVYVDSGSLNISSQRYDGKLMQRQMILHLPGEAHALFCDRSAAPEVIIIGFMGNCEALAPFAERPTDLDAGLQKLLAEIIREGRTVFAPPYDVPNTLKMNKRKNFPFGADQMIRNLLEEFWIRAVRRTEKTQEETESGEPGGDLFTQRIQQYIHENLSTHITVNEICLLFNTNKTTLHKVFKESFGETIVRYVNRERIHAAKKLIREGRKNLSQIAEEVGFSSLHYFTRTFVQYENTTPSLYSETIRSKLAQKD